MHSHAGFSKDDPLVLEIITKGFAL